MTTKISFFIFIAAVCLFAASIPALAQTEDRNVLERTKTDVHRFGTGEKAKIVVTMKDGRKVKGHIVRTGDDTFEVADSKSKQMIVIAYQDVSRIKKQGISKWVWVAVGVGAGAAVTVAILAVAAKNSFPDIRIARPSR